MEEEIIINGETYIKGDILIKKIEEFRESQGINKPKFESKMALRFNEYQQVKLITAIRNIFSMHDESLSDQEYLDKPRSIYDPANVCMIEGKTEPALRLLALFCPFNAPERSKPVLNFSPEYDFNSDKPLAEQVKVNPQVTKLSLEYLPKIINILKITSDSVKITLKKDYPVCFESEDFKIILAPRVED